CPRIRRTPTWVATAAALGPDASARSRHVRLRPQDEGLRGGEHARVRPVLPRPVARDLCAAVRGAGDAFAGEVDEHDPLLGPRGPLVSEDTRRRLGQAAAARVERGRGAAERQEPAVEVGDRARVLTQALDAPPLGLGRPREPRRYGPAVPRARVPWDRRAAAVPAAGIAGPAGRAD